MDRMINKECFDSCVRTALLKTWENGDREAEEFNLDEFGKHYNVLRDWFDNLYVEIGDMELFLDSPEKLLKLEKERGRKKIADQKKFDKIFSSNKKTNQKKIKPKK